MVCMLAVCRWIQNICKAFVTSCSVVAFVRRQTSHGQGQLVDCYDSLLSPHSLRQHFHIHITCGRLLVYCVHKCSTSTSPWPSSISTTHRHSQDYVWGALFCQKSWRPFFSRRPQRPSKYTSKSKPCSKKLSYELTLALAGGALRVLRVHLHIFPVN